MPKRKRRDQQHLGQTPARRRSYTVGGTAPAEKYKAGFPMSLLANVKAFYIIGAVIMIGGVLIAAVAKSANPSRTTQPNATPTATVSDSQSSQSAEAPARHQDQTAKQPPISATAASR